MTKADRPGNNGHLDELPTLVLLVLCYLGFGLVTMFADQIGGVFGTLGLAVIIAQHSSLQHEVLHGHPFRSERANDALVFPSIGLLIPYQRFKATHLDHHHDPNLTDPYDDPESNFLDPVRWHEYGRARQLIYEVNNTLAGRMLIGPAISLMCFYAMDVVRIGRGDRQVIKAYLLHGLGLAPVLAWWFTFSQLPFLSYLIAAYLGVSLLKIRTYLEHRAHERAPARSVIIQDRGPLALLFLNNNYHAVHHAHPGVVWHRLPALFRARRAEFLRRNDGYFYTSYAQLFRLYLFSRKDPVPHPWRKQVSAPQSPEAQPNAKEA